MLIFELAVLIAIGWFAGATLNYLADVLPATRSLSAAVCYQCQNRFSLLDFMFLHKCRSCGVRRSIRAWVVQIASIAATIAVWFFPPEELGPYVAFAVFFYFALIFIMDLEHRVIMHPVSITGAVLAIPLGIWLNGWLKTLIGGIAGFGIMLALYYFGELFRRAMARARKQPVEEIALGFGDVNLSGVLGLMLGWPRITANLVLGILLGGLVSGFYLLSMMVRKKYKAFTAVPYAPFLLIAAVILFYLA